MAMDADVDVDRRCVNCGGSCTTMILSAPMTMPMRDECVGIVRCSVSSDSRTTTRKGKTSVVCAIIVERFVIISAMVSIMPATRVGCVLFVRDGDVVGVASDVCRMSISPMSSIRLVG